MFFPLPSAQAGYTTIQSVDEHGILQMGAPNREVRDMLMAERLQMLTGSLHPEDVKMFAQHLRDGKFEPARVVLERMIKNTPPAKLPTNEADFSMVVCACTQKLPEMFLSTHVDFNQKLQGATPGRPDVCMVFAHNEAPHALVLELKFATSSKSVDDGLTQVVDKQYVERSVSCMNERLKMWHPEVPLLEPSKVRYLCFKLQKDLSVSMPRPGSVF